MLTENSEGGFGAAYRALSALEESGQCRRGYFVEGLGAAQFALTGAVDRLRSYSREPEDPVALVLAACDPANPYGAALPWPEREGHRPGRKPGALVVMVGGALIFYVERGGKTLLSFTEDPLETQSCGSCPGQCRTRWPVGQVDRRACRRCARLLLTGGERRAADRWLPDDPSGSSAATEHLSAADQERGSVRGDGLSRLELG